MNVSRSANESDVYSDARTMFRNPYARFLKEPRRKVVTWRPLNETDVEGYNPEATLKMKAKRVTEKICKEFCDWTREIGMKNDGIDEQELADMFQINFDIDASKSLQV